MSIQDVIDGRSRWCVVQGDVLSALDVGPVFDAVLCDPPYELTSGGNTGFMGQRWDGSGVSFRAETWARVLSHCKPGAPLMAFGGTRTFHRMTCAIEDSGWDIRDCLAEFFSPDVAAEAFLSSLSDAQLKAFDRAFHSAPNMAWVFGSGFPKSLNVSAAIDKATSATSSEPSTDAAKQWQGYGSSLKPAYEPIVLARKPLDGTVANNCQAHGCGALAIDASRIAGAPRNPGFTGTKGIASDGIFNSADNSKLIGYESPAGRWPANLLLDADSAALLDEQTGRLAPSIPHVRHNSARPQSVAKGADAAHVTRVGADDAGGASRFFYTSKASRTDRDHGLAARNLHPTVKPTDLIEYLARLILPPKRATPRLLYVPFAGSGSEMIGALRAGWDGVIGVEMNYADLAIERLTNADTAHQSDLFAVVAR